ncbi:M28 family peptidase [Algivirga pacifica]|uniref:M20/M25/M40 family metallo-hydrolase n=1 Tax=Algivirga pacifica TaxID=1162670 RepID=A0ABP9D6S1_9BACT
MTLLQRYLLTVAVFFTLDLNAQSLDEELLFRDVEVLSSDSMEGRKSGTAGADMAADYIIQRMKRIGVSPYKNEDYFHHFPYVLRRGKKILGKNIVSFIPGTSGKEEYIIFTAHYDHLGKAGFEIYNGADDNASGVAVLLALMTYFKTHPPVHHLIFIATDAEEQGLLGIKAFAKDHGRLMKQTLLNINMDMLSRATESPTLFAVGTYQYPALKNLIEEGPTPSLFTLVFGHDTPRDKGKDNWLNASDHGTFYQRDIPFLYFGVEDHKDYHETTDTYEKIDKVFYKEVARYLLDLAAYLDQQMQAVSLVK